MTYPVQKTRLFPYTNVQSMEEQINTLRKFDWIVRDIKPITPAGFLLIMERHCLSPADWDTPDLELTPSHSMGQEKAAQKR